MVTFWKLNKRVAISFKQLKNINQIPKIQVENSVGERRL
jgi:hypothetical protein